MLAASQTAHPINPMLNFLIISTLPGRGSVRGSEFLGSGTAAFVSKANLNQSELLARIIDLNC
jgi:hypothetical protein